MCAYCVDFFAEGEVPGMGCIVDLLLMAFAAGYRHPLRVAWPSNQSGMSLVDLPHSIEAIMAGSAGQVVGGGQGNFAMATRAAECFGCDRYRLGSGSFLRFRRGSVFGAAAAQQEENNE